MRVFALRIAKRIDFERKKEWKQTEDEKDRCVSEEKEIVEEADKIEIEKGDRLNLKRRKKLKERRWKVKWWKKKLEKRR